MPVIVALLAANASADEVVIWHSWRGDEKASLEQAAQTWADRTHNTVSLLDIPFGAFDSKVETAIPRGNGPDLFVAGHGNLGKWTAMGIVDPLPQAVPGQMPASTAAVTVDGKVWGAPLAVKSVVLLYDPTRVTVPPKTTDELFRQAHELQGDGYGVLVQVDQPYFHGPWMHAFGGALFDAQGRLSLDTDAQIQALAFARRLAVDEGVVPPQPTSELLTRLYREGQAPFVISGPWFVAELDRPIAAAPLPVVSEAGAHAKPFLTVDAAFVADQAKHPEAARDLAAFLAGTEGATIRQEVGRQAVSALDVTSDDPLLQVLAEQARTSVPLPTHPDVQSAFEAQARALRDVIRGAATPEAAAHAAQQYAAILSKPPPPPADPRPWMALLALLIPVAGYLGLRGSGGVGRLAERVVRHRWDYAWIAPAVIALSALVVAPLIAGATVSLFEHDEGHWSFVGAANFLNLLLARDFPVTSALSFWFKLVVTLVWTAANVALHVGLGIALALALREPWIRMRAGFRALLVIPWAVPNYITALVWKGMFHAQYGAVNAVLGALTLSDGPAHIDWFGSFLTAFTANLVTNTWLGFPFMMVVTLGALQGIPRELEEAAEVDGASWWFRFRHVVWPMLAPALLPAVVLGSVWTFNMFNVVFLVSQGEPNSTTEILVSEAYRWAFTRGNRYGLAAAYAVLVFAVLLIYTRFTDRLLADRTGRRPA
ncbi:MAG: extracellular solute-binding protein [Alphaproteobacteria bacterium]|nr:extracellular solute-binding protein [Alphaproteobacteria bacterium]